jgi:hypothetical protein
MPRTADSRRQRPLATIRQPYRLTIYRGKFRPFEATRYLDVAALRRVSKATIEIGTLEAPGVSCTLAAEVRRGMITRLTPLPCAGCTRRRPGKAKLRRILTDATRRIEALGLPQLRLPAPVARARTWGGSIGPIVIVIDEGIPCVWIYIGDTVCVFCAFDVIEGICI